MLHWSQVSVSTGTSVFKAGPLQLAPFSHHWSCHSAVPLGVLGHGAPYLPFAHLPFRAASPTAPLGSPGVQCSFLRPCWATVTLPALSYPLMLETPVTCNSNPGTPLALSWLLRPHSPFPMNKILCESLVLIPLLASTKVLASGTWDLLESASIWTNMQ